MNANGEGEKNGGDDDKTVDGEHEWLM